MNHPRRLNDRDKKVLDAYYGVANFNKTEALRVGGFEHPSKAHNFFKRKGVIAEMERREKAAQKKYEISYDRLMDELMRVAMSHPFEYLNKDEDGYWTVDLDKCSVDEIRGLGEVKLTERWYGKGDDRYKVVTVKVKGWDKISAIDKLLRHGGYSKEKLVVEGNLTLADRIRQARDQVDG